MAANPSSSHDPSWPGRKRKHRTARSKKTPASRPAPSPPAETEASQLAADWPTPEIKRQDRRLIVAVLLLAFLLASFTVRNSDYWMHLATGRAIAEGKYTFGTDPFAYTTADTTWVNHSWLAEVALYGLTRLSGGTDAPGGSLVVVLKALLTTLLAWVLLLIRRREQSALLPVICITLGLVALSPHLLLRPTCVSFLFLGLTVWVLQREGRPEPGAETRGWRLLLPSAPARLYVLPPLFALWVNLDSWFLLGPLTLGLYLFADIVQSHLSPQGERRALLVSLGLGLLACLLNPHFAAAFTLPPDLVAMVQMQPLSRDVLFHSLFLSPFEPGYFADDLGMGTSIAGLSYYVLLGLGLFAFVWNRADCPAWRLALWLTFALLSALHWRLIPFFAVVAAPITALNLQDAVVRRQGSGPPPNERGRRLAILRRSVTLLVLLVLLLLTWPGWLQKSADRLAPPRRVAWGVEASPSLAQAAQQLATWRSAGLLPADSRGFNWVPDFASYFAWYCPEEKSFFDYRLALFAGVADDYAIARRSLTAGPNARVSGRDWQDVFRAHKIDHLVFHGSSRESMLRRLLSDPHQWHLLYLDGRTTILGWHDPDQKQPPPWTKLALDFDARAFGPQAERAPHDGPARSAQAVGFWRHYASGPVMRPLDADQASAFQVLYEQSYARIQGAQQSIWQAALDAGFVAAPGGHAGFVATAANLAVRGDTAYTPGDVYIGPSAFPLLAVRGARRAVALQPDDDEGWLRLAVATYYVWRKQENRCVGLPLSLPLQPQYLRHQLATRNQRLGQRQLIRAAQTLYALEQARTLRPDTVLYHQWLAEVFWQIGYFDLTLHHQREALRLARAQGPAPAENSDLAKQLIRLDQTVQELEKQVEALRAEFQRLNADVHPLLQAQRACFGFGLAQEALSVLQHADLAGSAQALDLRIYLTLTTGRIDSLVEGDPLYRPQLLRTSFKQRLDEAAAQGIMLTGADFHQAVLSAVVGDYGRARETLDGLIQSSTPSAAMSLSETVTGLAVNQLQLDPLGRTMSGVYWKRHIEPELNTLLTTATLLGETRVLRGLLALEEGDTAAAARDFRLAVRSDGPPVHIESRPIALSYVEKLPK
jgi:hypothetical protein